MQDAFYILQVKMREGWQNAYLSKDLDFIRTKRVNLEREFKAKEMRIQVMRLECAELLYPQFAN